MFFYVGNTSWAAPLILTQTDEKTLDLTAKLQSVQQTRDTVHLDIERMQRTITEMEDHRASLAQLRPSLDIAIRTETAHNHQIEHQLHDLNRDKVRDIANTQALLSNLETQEVGTKTELAAGLITKTEALARSSQLAQMKNQLTDGRISEVMMRDNESQRNGSTTQVMDTLDRREELKSQVAQLDINIALSKQQLVAEQGQLAELDRAVALVRSTPYYMAMTNKDPAQFAFVPYENQRNIRVGEPIYNCYLEVLLCHQVGTVSGQFNTEEHTTHPFLHTELRGVLISLDLSEPQAAKSKTLFLNRKPLLM
jgi:septal ring factor EnvC (AmiA/AmiB activator)